MKMRHNYPYAWRYGWRWILSYLQRGAIIPALRQVYWVYVRGYDGEACDCGRPYPWWHASDDLWREVYERGHAYRGGLCCVNCFDKRARRLGIVLQWQPVEQGRE